jgi:hypothetical protein
MARRANRPFRQTPQPVALRIKTVIATNNKVFFISCVVPAGGTLRSRGLPEAMFRRGGSEDSRRALQRFLHTTIAPVVVFGKHSVEFLPQFLDREFAACGSCRPCDGAGAAKSARNDCAVQQAGIR